MTLNPGFSTADADRPDLNLTSGDLVIRFNDWREQSVTVKFTDVAGLKWQEIEELLEGEPFDGICELIDSPWLSALAGQGARAPKEQHRHFSLNFNACGKLEVLAVGMHLET